VYWTAQPLPSVPDTIVLSKKSTEIPTWQRHDHDPDIRVLVCQAPVAPVTPIRSCPQNFTLGCQWTVKAYLALPSSDTYRLATHRVSNIKAHWMKTSASWKRSWSERRAKRHAQARSHMIDLQIGEERRTQDLHPRAEVLFMGSSQSAA
jgi:hypothetical protein